MSKQSQKKLLNEGFGSLLRKSLASAARGAAAAGGALKSASDAGVKASVGGIVQGAKAGYEKEKEAQKKAVGKDAKLKSYIEDLALLPIGSFRGSGDIRVIDVAELDYDDETGEEKKGQIFSKPLVVKWDKDDRAWSTVRSPKGEEQPDIKKKKKKKTKEKVAVFKPDVGQEVLVRTTKVPTGEPGIVKQLNPNGRITVATAGNKAGYAFNPKNVLPNPRVKNENSSQRILLRQLTLLID